jgi:hypothetical protein
MKIKKAILLIICVIILLILGTLPLWLDYMATSIFGFPAFLLKETNAFIEAVKWLFDKIFNNV